MSLLLDVNVLLALSLDNHVRHNTATRWFTAIDEPWATTPLTEAGFVRLMSNRHVVDFDITTRDALAALVHLRTLPGHEFLADDITLTETRIDVGRLIGPDQVTDFHLVNLAATHGRIFATFDASLYRSLADADRRHVLVVAD